MKPKKSTSFGVYESERIPSSIMPPVEIVGSQVGMRERWRTIQRKRETERTVSEMQNEEET